MKAWAVVAHGAPLECVEIPDPVPVGTEVVVEVTHCGVCHSDLHLWHGGYDLGGGRMLSVRDRGIVLPAAPGHEIVGRVARLGPDASGVAVGDERVVYPWVGCGHCPRCLAEEDNLCSNQRSLGVSVNGGFGRLVKVPHSALPATVRRRRRLLGGDLRLLGTDGLLSGSQGAAARQ